MRLFHDRDQESDAVFHSQHEDSDEPYAVSFARTLGTTLDSVEWSVKRGTATISNESESSGVAQAFVSGLRCDSTIQIKATAGNRIRIKRLKLRAVNDSYFGDYSYGQ